MDHSSFYFVDKIYTRQRDISVDKFNERLADLWLEGNMIDACNTAVNNSVNNLKDDSIGILGIPINSALRVDLSSGNYLKFVEDEPSSGGVGAVPCIGLYNMKGDKLRLWVGHQKEPWSKNPKKFLKQIEYERKWVLVESMKKMIELNAVEDDKVDIWSYIDFLYFSVITQGTVGYGDIIPNCRLVRVLVATQVVIGYMILVVIINLVINGIGEAEKNASVPNSYPESSKSDDSLLKITRE
jgi:hypothetical protein